MRREPCPRLGLHRGPPRTTCHRDVGGRVVDKDDGAAVVYVVRAPRGHGKELRLALHMPDLRRVDHLIDRKQLAQLPLQVGGPPMLLVGHQRQTRTPLAPRRGGSETPVTGQKSASNQHAQEVVDRNRPGVLRNGLAEVLDRKAPDEHFGPRSVEEGPMELQKDRHRSGPSPQPARSLHRPRSESSNTPSTSSATTRPSSRRSAPDICQVRTIPAGPQARGGATLMPPWRRCGGSS